MYRQIFFFCFIFLTISVKAQIGVSTKDPNATLEVLSKPNDVNYYDGILPPQLTGDELNNKTYTAEQLGAIVYVTQPRTNADKGQTAKVTTADLYLFDGTSWLPMSLQPEVQNQPMVHSVSSVNNTFTSEVNGASASISLVKTMTHQLQGNDLKTQINGVSSAPITIPNVYTKDDTASGDINTIKLNNHNLSISNTGVNKNNQVNILGVLSVNLLARRLGVGFTNPIATVDVRPSYSRGQPQEGIIGIGGTNLSASQAGAGAIRYNYNSNNLEYSNGVAWNYLVESVNQRTIVIAKKISNQSQTISNDSKIKVIKWSEIIDTNGEYDPNQGMFKPKKAGNYYISLSLNFDFKEEYPRVSINDNSYAEATIEVKRGGGVVMERKSTASFSGYNSPSYSPRRDSELGVFIATVLPLQKNDEVNIYIKHNMGISKKLRVGNIHSDGFINFSVTEL